MGILSNLFENRWRRVWREFAAETGARLIEGGMMHGDQVISNMHGWPVVLDLLAEPGVGPQRIRTRLRVPFRRENNFRFELAPKPAFAVLEKVPRLPSVTPGFPEFLETHTLSASDAERARWLFEDEALRTRIISEPGIALALNHDPRERADVLRGANAELLVRLPDVAAGVERLKRLHSIAVDLAERLRQGGVATPVTDALV